MRIFLPSRSGEVQRGGHSELLILPSELICGDSLGFMLLGRVCLAVSKLREEVVLSQVIGQLFANCKLA
jgi:hypothetical protein